MSRQEFRDYLLSRIEEARESDALVTEVLGNVTGPENRGFSKLGADALLSGYASLAVLIDRLQAYNNRFLDEETMSEQRRLENTKRFLDSLLTSGIEKLEKQDKIEQERTKS